VAWSSRTSSRTAVDEAVARVVTETILRTGNVSVDPYMRQLMDGGWPLHEPLDQGRAIGRVVKSETGEFPEGALVVHTGGWSTHAAVFPGQRGARLVQPASGIDATLTLRGYMVRHYMHLRDEAEAWLIPRLRSGALRADEQIVSGFDNIVSAFLGMLRGENIGKTIVQIASDSSRQGRPLLPSDGPGRVPAEGPR